MFSVAVNNQQGQQGSNYITDTTLHNPDTTPVKRGPWKTIECISDCTFTTLVDQTSTPKDCHTIALAAGRVTFGNFTDIRLATGSVKAYY